MYICVAENRWIRCFVYKEDASKLGQLWAGLGINSLRTQRAFDSTLLRF